MDKSFIIHLPSNASSSHDNTCASFYTKLPYKLRLDNSWKVGLIEISYTKSWYNIEKDIKLHFMLEKVYVESAQEGSPTTVSVKEVEYFEPLGALLTLKQGYYKNLEDIEAFLKEGIKKLTDIFIQSTPGGLLSKPAFIFDSRKRKFYWIPGSFRHANLHYKLHPTFGADNDYMLGITSRYLEYGVRNNKPFDQDNGIRNLYVYTDIVRKSVVGDSFSNLLRIVETPPQSVEFGDQYKVKYKNVMYLELSSHEIDGIKIDIRTDSGELVPFQFGRTVLSLIFTKYD